MQDKLKEKSQIDSEKRNTKRENESRTPKKNPNAEECLFETEMGKRREMKKEKKKNDWINPSCGTWQLLTKRSVC